MKNTPKILLTVFVLLLNASLFSCSAKKVATETSEEPEVKKEEVVSKPVEKVEEKISNVPVNTQHVEPKCTPLWGTDSVKALESYSLYRDEFKKKNYKEAYVFWRYVFDNAPCAREQTMADAPFILNSLIDNETNKERKKLLLDTLMLSYDMRIKYFDSDGYTYGKKARDMFSYTPERLDEILELFRKSVELEGNGTDSYVPVPYLQASIEQHKKKKLALEELVGTYEKLMSIADYNFQNNVKKRENWEVARGNLNLVMGPWLDCNTLIKIYSKPVKEHPDSIALLEKVANLLNSKDCKSELSLQVAENLFKLKPTAEGAARLGFVYKSGSPSKAINYFDKAIEMETENSKKADYYIQIADLYIDMKSCSQGRNAALKAISFNPNSGKAYLLIGSAYVTCAADCGSDFERKAVYWTAVDKFQKAKSVDPSVADDANRLIGVYSKYFPGDEELFFRGLKKGVSYKVECWINETTTVR